MFTRILVPLNGSALAEQVLPDAARLARANGATVMLVRVIRPLVEYEAMRPAPGAWLPAADNTLRDAATAYLNELRAKEPLLDVSTEAHVLVGPVAPIVLRAADDERADIIVMSTQGRKGIARWLQGSVAGAVIRDAQVPVLVLREAATPLAADLAAGQPVSALVPLDGSPLAEAALEPAVQLAAAMSQGAGGSIHLLRVVDPPPERPASDSPAARQEHAERRRDIRRELRNAREYLDTAAAGVRKLYADAHGVSVTWSIARGHNVAEAILGATRSASGAALRADKPESVNLIAMGTHGRGGLKRWIMGSVAERVVREAAIPVLVVRPRAGDLDVAVRPAESVEVADQDEGGLRLA
ncbi:MAG TPA: universal stress protein [Ktedonobacterales bacterium]